MARNKRHTTPRKSAKTKNFVPSSTQGVSSSSFKRKASKNNTGTINNSTYLTSQAAQANQYSRNAVNYSGHKIKGTSNKGKIAVIIIAIILVGAIAALGFYIYKENQKAVINEDLHKMSKDAMDAIDNELTGMRTFEEPFNVLVLGSDARSGDPDMGARTDTIILARIDPTKNIISMISIPRDTKIEIPGHGTNKFNAAYSFGGPAGSIAAIKNLCDVNIDHFVEIDFEGLVGLIDAIGGIDIHVDETIDDPDAGNIVIPEGDQHLNGEEALVFSRSRAYANGDFTRVSNQRKVIEAVVHKGLVAPASDLYGIIKASTEFLTTDSAMDADFIFSLADQIRHNNDYEVKMYSATLPSSPQMIGGVSYVIENDAESEEMIRIFLNGGDVGAYSDSLTEASAAKTTSSSSSTSSQSSSSTTYSSSVSTRSPYSNSYGY